MYLKLEQPLQFFGSSSILPDGMADQTLRTKYSETRAIADSELFK